MHLPLLEHKKYSTKLPSSVHSLSKSLTMRIINIVWSMFYTVAPAQEPLREFSEEMVKTNTMETMCAIHQSKGQLTNEESSTPTDIYVLNLHSPYLSQHTHITSIFSFINPCILRTFSYADLDVTFRNKCSSNTVNTIFRL